MALSVRPAIAIGTVALVLVTSPAAGEPTAKKAPVVSGPLELERKDCEPPVRSKADNGEIGIVTQKCLWLYQYPSNKESSGKDYGVAWVQTYLSPRNGWCLKWAESGILNYDKHILRKAPSKGFEAAEERKFTTKLNATPDADPPPPNATIKQSWQLLPGKVSIGTVQDGRFFKLRWEGATTKSVAFAVGIQVWWDPAKQSSTNAGGSVESKLRRSC